METATDDKKQATFGGEKPAGMLGDWRRQPSKHFSPCGSELRKLQLSIPTDLRRTPPEPTPTRDPRLIDPKDRQF